MTLFVSRPCDGVMVARKTVTTTEFTDDLTGERAAGTVSFGYEGRSYEIDLSKTNARTLEKLLRPYIDAGREVRPTRGRAPRRAPRNDVAGIRAWAKSNGLDVSTRGRIPRSVLEAYEAAS